MPAATCKNRLTVIGRSAAFGRFDWSDEAKAKHIELLECSHRRWGWQFETDSGPPLAWMVKASKRWPSLIFLLDYELEELRRKGMVSARKAVLTER